MTSAILISITSAAIIVLWLSQQWRFAGPERRAHRIFSIILSIALPLLIFTAGQSGVFRNFTKFPPPLIFFLFAIIGVSFFLAFSRFGSVLVHSVSLRSLVLFHSFRFLAETSIYLGVKEGIAPVQMSMQGYNFDIVTASLSLILWFAIGHSKNKKLISAFALGFNILGLVILTSIMFIAITSMPAPFRLFHSEPSNIWVTGNPYIFLPGILVLAALTGHLLIFRKLKLISAA